MRSPIERERKLFAVVSRHSSFGIQEIETDRGQRSERKQDGLRRRERERETRLTVSDILTRVFSLIFHG